MSSETLDENILFVINEKFVDFDDLKDKVFDLRKILSKQKLNGYFHILHGPIYINLVKEFWLNASVVPAGHDEVMQSYVNGSHLFVTLSLNAETINCKETNSCVEHYRFNNVYSFYLHQIYTNSNKPTSPSTLLPIAKV